MPSHFQQSKKSGKSRDYIPIAHIPIPNHPARGAFCRTLSNVGWRRRPRAGLVTPLPGGPGQPSGPTMRACLKWLDVVATKGGGSRPDRRAEIPAGSLPGSTAPGTEIAAKVERRTATHPLAPDAPAARRRLVVAPCGAPPPRTSHLRSAGSQSPAPPARGNDPPCLINQNLETSQCHRATIHPCKHARKSR